MIGKLHDYYCTMLFKQMHDIFIYEICTRWKGDTAAYKIWHWIMHSFIYITDKPNNVQSVQIDCIVQIDND